MLDQHTKVAHFIGEHVVQRDFTSVQRVVRIGEDGEY